MSSQEAPVQERALCVRVLYACHPTLPYKMMAKSNSYSEIPGLGAMQNWAHLETSVEALWERGELQPCSCYHWYSCLHLWRVFGVSKTTLIRCLSKCMAHSLCEMKQRVWTSKREEWRVKGAGLRSWVKSEVASSAGILSMLTYHLFCSGIEPMAFCMVGKGLSLSYCYEF